MFSELNRTEPPPPPPCHGGNCRIDTDNIGKIFPELDGAAPPPCHGANCRVNEPNLVKIFPKLAVRPRPEPPLTSQEDHEAWLKEYEQWSKVQCGCGRGYFCREHGSWITGGEVGDESALPSDKQKVGACPAYHTDYDGITTYIGERDWAAGSTNTIGVAGDDN